MKIIALYCLLILQPVVSYPINENSSGLFENDIAGTSYQPNEIFWNFLQNRSDVLGTVRRGAGKWYNNKVPYSFSYHYDYSMQNKVIRAMNEIESKTCIDFVRRTDEHSYIMFIRDYSNQCYSSIGRTGGEQSICLPDWCLDSHDSVLHEIMHALGFLHEHNRHDRDDHININWSNVNSMGGHYMDNNWIKRDRSELEYFNTKYDYKSVMHYPATVSGRTIITPFKYGVVIASNGLSVNDVYRINKLYNCHQITTAEGDDDNSRNDDHGLQEVDYPCTVGFYYCGSELRKKNFTNILSDHYLYYCDNNHKAVYSGECGNGCLVEGSSRCACENSQRYCGFELANMNWNKNFNNKAHTLYQCDNGNRVFKLYECSVKCHKYYPSSNCAFDFAET